jgi:integrase
MEIKEYNVGKKVFYSCRFWYYKNGQKKSKYKKGFDGKKKASDWGINEKRRLRGLQAGADDLKLKEFLEKWMKVKRGKLSPNTIAGYEVNIAHINESLGEEVMDDITLLDIQNMLDELTESGLKHNTVKYVYRTLHAAYEYAVKSEIVEKNVCKGAEIKEDEEKFEATVYSSDDLRKLILLLREQEHYLYPLVLLASMRGLRRGETLAFKWDDIDFENGIAYVRKTYNIVKKKKTFGKVKTKDSERTIDMEGFVAEELKAYKERLNKAGIIQTYVCEVNGALPDPTHISRGLKAFQRANGLPECRFHDLRHTFAVLQLENGTDLDTLKRLLGHSKIAITSDLYLHENMTLLKKASKKMDKVVQLEKPKKKKSSKAQKR